jgi:ketosteroid isomerase-like protein
MILGGAAADDLEAERQALLQADRDFAAATAKRGGDAWGDIFAEDGVLFPQKGRVDGNEAVRETMKPAFGEGLPMLRWEPTEAVVGSGGDLGYTLGRWEMVAESADGKESISSRGNYVTIWRKIPGQGWRIVVDIGNEDAEE